MRDLITKTKSKNTNNGKKLTEGCKKVNKSYDLNKKSAQRLLLGLVENNETRMLLVLSLIHTLTEDPVSIFKAIDELWDWQEEVPPWVKATFKTMDQETIPNSVNTFSELAKEIKSTIQYLFINKLLIIDPKKRKCFVDYKDDIHCWICDKAKKYQDCLGNDILKIYCMNDWLKKVEPDCWVNFHELEILFGCAEEDIIIKCQHCATQWNKSKDFCGEPLCEIFPEYTAFDIKNIINNWINNGAIDWYRCPFGCNAKTSSNNIHIVLQAMLFIHRYKQLENDCKRLTVVEMKESKRNMNRRDRLDRISAIEEALNEASCINDDLKNNPLHFDMEQLNLADSILKNVEESLRNMDESSIKERLNVVEFQNLNEFQNVE